ncbi:transglutaminase family protein [Acidisphaera sp. L21]|uniref:transglutaminase-like domain-containing protein n=1 Tax=Acidisphaera sp. L21 TaxID=1641851 RepID=UPI00131DFFD3|nr:transglutaminase family protein [Acidisphaera sp. L21]
MDFTIGCTLRYQVEAPTPFVFNLEAARLPRQRIVSETLTTSPDLGQPDRFDAPESGNRFIRYVVPAGEFQIDYRAQIALDPLMLDPTGVTEIPGGSLPMEVLTYLNASRYCQSDRLNRFANRQFGGGGPTGHQRVTAICNWIRDNVDYQAGTSDALTSAYDTLGDRAGVCRDFAHLAITLCRAVGIPARYISAYAWQLSPPDFHAVFEAFLHGPGGGAWYLFDPTRMAALDGLVRIGAGRDAADVAFCSIYGGAQAQPPSVWINGPTPNPIRTTQAVSTQAP